MTSIPLHHVDAFALELFRGNPAAVCPLETWLDDALLQSIATENNLSETAFFVPEGDRYRLRWFTPVREVPLCGHATLAAASVIFRDLPPSRDHIAFDTLSGPLHVSRRGDLLTLDFPVRPPVPCATPPELLAGLGLPPLEVLFTEGDTNYYAVYGREGDVRDLQPDTALLGRLPHGVCATAPGESVDFVSRYFVPSYGIPEDPVTGSTHCALPPYWSRRLGKTSLLARQLSARGGELACELAGDRVRISGRAMAYLDGRISLP